MDLEKIGLICKKHKLKVLILFGSLASGKSKKESDIDLAFYSLTNVDYEQLYQDLMILLHREDIDLVDLAKTHNQILRYQILSKGKVLFEESKGLANKMKWQSYFDYVDFNKYYLRRSKIIDSKIASLEA